MPNQVVFRRCLLRFWNDDRQKMADDLGTTVQSVGYYVLGDREPSRKILERLSKFLSIDLNDLWMPEPDTVYFKGAKLKPGAKGYDQVVGNIKLARPDLARKLGL